MSEKNNNIFSHPEVEKVLKKALSNLVQESDRGAILVAAEMINSQLEKLFEAKNSGSKTLNRKILKYPGPLSNFSARLDVAYAVGYIGKNLYSSIKILKKIRNEAAHSKSDFDLNTQKNRLKETLKLGPNIPASITSMASEYLVLSTVDRVWKNREDDNLEEPIFKSKEEIYDFLANDEEAISTLDEFHPRVTLSFGIALITGLIVYSKEDKASNEEE